MIEKNKQLKINHEMITVLRSENEKLEDRMRVMEKELHERHQSDMAIYGQIEAL
jgi:ABC-type Fe3+/spermidine/putrescine transport system ATPase subunit